MRGNLIEDNSAGEGGGLAASTDGSMTIVDNVIRRNTAHTRGGGVMLSGGDDVVFVQNVVVENSAGDSGGGMIAFDSSTMLANTIAGNTSARASAVDASDGMPGMTFRGNVMAGPSGSSVVACERDFGWDLPSFQENIVHNGDPQPAVVCEDGALAADPRFVNPDVGDYRLGRGSPAVDTGVTSPLLPAPSREVANAHA